MIQKLNPILKEAKKKNRAVGAFTATNFEVLRAIIEVAEKRNEPVIIKHSFAYEDEAPLKYMGPAIIELSKKSKVDICPMLDHCKDPVYTKDGLKMGFTAVMYDGTGLSIDDNIKIGNEMVNLAKSADANIEAGIRVDLDYSSGDGKIKNMDDILKFVRDVDVDALAPLFFNKASNPGEYGMNFKAFKEIAEKTNLPLVLHGAGHMPKEYIKTAIESGISKINYFSVAGINELQHYIKKNPEFSFAAIINHFVNAVARDIDEAMEIMANK